MALATRCPSCNTVFRIGTAQAAAKGGMVRCGQCRDVFNSLDALVRVEDLDVIGEVLVGAHGATAASPSSDSLAPHDAADRAADATAAEDAPSRAGVEDPWHETVVALESIESPPAAGVDADADGTGSDMPGETGSAPEAPAVVGEWWLPDPNASAQSPDALAAASGDPAPSADGATPDDAQAAPGLPLSGRRTDLQSDGAALESTNPTFMRPDVAAPRPARGARWLFGVLSLVAVAALLGQAVYAWRDELAVRWSPAARWLTAACVPLRCTVDYPEHLDAISIESAAVQASGLGPDVYVMTALLRNREALDVRYPHLELVLTDVQDRPILRRALRPEDYLPSARSEADGATSGFAAQSELPVRLMFELAGLRFAGYRLDRFYP